MKLVRHLLLITILLLVAGIASAVSIPITLQLDSVTLTVVGPFPSTQTFTPTPPFAGAPGSSSIDLGAGTGTLTLPDYTVSIDLAFNGVGEDALLSITSWTQTITAIDGAGNITSTGGGSVGCTPVGSLVCSATPPTVLGWPPAAGATLLSSAVIDAVAQTITVVDSSAESTAGQITSLYSYTIIPEPGTALLLGGGLLGIWAAGRKRR
jgi:hypothetical protein